MSWIVFTAYGKYLNGRVIPTVIGPFMSEEAANRCVLRLQDLADGRVGIAVREMVTPVTAYSAAAMGVDLAYGGRATDQWVYGLPADSEDETPTSWGSGHKVEVVTGPIEYLEQRGRHAALEARGMSVVPLDKDGKPIEVRRRFM